VKDTSSSVASRLRAGLLGLAGIGVAGTGLELASIRHWGSVEQLVPWFVLGVLAAGIAAVGVRPCRVTALAGRLVGVVSVVGGSYGVIEHVVENLDAGPLDHDYAARWGSMSGAGHLWAAASGAVGPAPLLAPAILAFIGLCLALATVGLRPAVRRQHVPSA
jgi:hypothetical protein